MAVEAVDAQEHALILDELLQIGTPAHATYDRPPNPDMLDFARAGAAVGGTSATLEKTRALAEYFRTLDDDDLRRAAVFMSGRPFGPSRRSTGAPRTATCPWRRWRGRWRRSAPRAGRPRRRRSRSCCAGSTRRRPDSWSRSSPERCASA